MLPALAFSRFARGGVLEVRPYEAKQLEGWKLGPAFPVAARLSPRPRVTIPQATHAAQPAWAPARALVAPSVGGPFGPVRRWSKPSGRFPNLFRLCFVPISSL